MARVALTAGRINDFECPQGKSQAFLWDTEAPGLGVRVTPAKTGANGEKVTVKSYVFQAKLAGKTIRTTIGDVRVWALDAPKRTSPDEKAKSARTEARRLKMLVDEGRDPRDVKAEVLANEQDARAVRAANEVAARVKRERDNVTLDEAWRVYVEARQTVGRGKNKKKKWSDWHIRDHESVTRRGGVVKKRGKGLTQPGPLAPLLDVPLSALTGDRIADWLAVETESRPTQAALAFRLLSVFLNWCESSRQFAGIVPAGACKEKVVRDELPNANAKTGDCLQREQLKAWFLAVCSLPNQVVSVYLQVLLLTGARRREVAALRWVDVDFEWKKMVIRDKVNSSRVIPLTPYVEHLLGQLPRKNGWVFFSAASSTGQLTEPTRAHKRALQLAGLPNITLHGLRRSFGTIAEWTETPVGIVAQIQGHKPSAVAEKHYRVRPIDLLRVWHARIEAWMLAEAGITFDAGVHSDAVTEARAQLTA